MLCIVLCAATALGSEDAAAQNASSQDSTGHTVPAGTCRITGYRAAAQATTPAYLPGETTRQSELGAKIRFPVAALGYDPATQRFAVALEAHADVPADQGTGLRLIELRRKHVVFEGDSCPGEAQNGGSIRCFESTTLASRGSNPVYCQKDKSPASE